MRSLAMVFSVRFFRVAPVHFSTEPFCVRSLARFFPWAFSQGVPPLQSFALTVSIEFFAGSFSVHYPEGNFLVHFFPGPPPCIFLHVRLPWALSLGLFWYVFSQGVYHGLFLGDIFRELFRMNN